MLAAVYAASKLSARFRPPVFALIWRATRWEGEVDEHLVDYLTGDEAAYRVRRDRSYDPGWALTVLGFDDGTDPGRGDVVRRFRRLVRDAHPDHGAEAVGAGLRITELTEAKRILLEPRVSPAKTQAEAGPACCSRPEQVPTATSRRWWRSTRP